MGRAGLILVSLFTWIILGGCTPRPSSAQSLSVQEAWARPGISGGNSAIYFIIDNPTPGADTLLNASSDIAAHVELHMSSMDADGNMMMQRQENVPVGANSQVEFKPGGLHVMLIELSQDLQVGDTFPVTLQFEESGTIQVQATVK